MPHFRLSFHYAKIMPQNKKKEERESASMHLPSTMLAVEKPIDMSQDYSIMALSVSDYRAEAFPLLPPAKRPTRIVVRGDYKQKKST